MVAIQNSAPIVSDDAATTTGGRTILGNLLSGITLSGVRPFPETLSIFGRDIDLDGDPLTVGIKSGMSTLGGQFAIMADGSFSYRAASGVIGMDTISYTVSDGVNPAVTGYLRIAIADQNNNILNGTKFFDIINGLAGNDFIKGYAGDDIIDGDTGNDSLYGGTGNDSLLGGAGDDLLDGGAGDDYMVGGTGNDRIFSYEGADILNLGTGDDVVYLGTYWTFVAAFDVSDLALKVAVSVDNPDTGSNNDMIVSMSDSTGNDSREIRLEDQLLAGSAIERDTLFFGNGERLYIVKATNGADVVSGTGYNDQIYTFDGNDTVRAGSGFDIVYGGNGNDSLYGQNGMDILNGGAGNDLLDGGADNDSLSGGDGNDILKGRTGDDFLAGGLGDDKMYGEDGSDFMLGGIGNDSLDGGTGDDYLQGGTGRDHLTGGRGADTFGLDITGDLDGLLDVIYDFEIGIDRISTSFLEPAVSPVGLQASINDYLSLRESGGNTVLSFDYDGQGTAYQMQDAFLLRGITGFTDGDSFAANLDYFMNSNNPAA